MPQRGNLFVGNAYIYFGSLPQRGNLITFQIITQEIDCSAGARIIFSLRYLQTGYAAGVKMCCRHDVVRPGYSKHSSPLLVADQH